jgi:hypothetical protein
LYIQFLNVSIAYITQSDTLSLYNYIACITQRHLEMNVYL